MSAEVLKYVTPSGTEYELNHTVTNIDDSTTSGKTAWSSSKTSQAISTAQSAVQTNLNSEITARTNADSVLSGNITTVSTNLATVSDNLTAHTSNKNNPHEVTAEQLGLGDVENTKLSTWTGSSNLTTCNKGSFGTACTKNYTTNMSTDTDTTKVPTVSAVKMYISSEFKQIIFDYLSNTTPTFSTDTWTNLMNSGTLADGWRRGDVDNIDWYKAQILSATLYVFRYRSGGGGSSNFSSVEELDFDSYINSESTVTLNVKLKNSHSHSISSSYGCCILFNIRNNALDDIYN